MTTFQAGDPVIVKFMGIECEGEVIAVSPIAGYVSARITIPDPEVDFGSIDARFDPQPVVCVPPKRVRPNLLRDDPDQAILGIASGISMPPNPH